MCRLDFENVQYWSLGFVTLSSKGVHRPHLPAFPTYDETGRWDAISLITLSSWCRSWDDHGQGRTGTISRLVPWSEGPVKQGTQGMWLLNQIQLGDVGQWIKNRLKALELSLD